MDEKIKQAEDIRVSYKCNNNCLFCVVSSNRFKKDFGLKEVKKEIDKAVIDNINKLTITGGEPLIRRDIIEILEYCKDKKFRIINIESNGRMYCYENLTKKILELDLTELIISIHGCDKKTHDFLTRVEGSFNQTLKGIKNIIKFGGLDKITLNIVVTRQNYKKINDIIRFFSKMGIKRFFINSINPFGNAWKYRKLVIPDYGEMIKEISKTIDIYRNNSNIKIFINHINPKDFNEKYHKYIMKTYLIKTEIDGFEDIWRGIINCSLKSDVRCKLCKYNGFCKQAIINLKDNNVSNLI